MSWKQKFSRFLSADPDRLHFAAHSHHPWPDVSFDAHQRYWLDSIDMADDDKKAAELLINSQEEIADTTGNPKMVHVFAETSEAMLKFLAFTADLSDAPFLVD